jgi:hypothetical protein
MHVPLRRDEVLMPGQLLNGSRWRLSFAKTESVLRSKGFGHTRRFAGLVQLAND